MEFFYDRNLYRCYLIGNVFSRLDIKLNINLVGLIRRPFYLSKRLPLTIFSKSSYHYWVAQDYHSTSPN